MKPRIRSSDPFVALHTLTPVVPPAAEPLPARRPASERSALETLHPGIAHAVTLLWGFPEMKAYFAKLWLADDRQMPIHPDAMAELMLLARVHDQLLPEHEPSSNTTTIYGTAYTGMTTVQRDVWGQVAHRR